MDTEFKVVFQRLEKKGIFVNTASLKKHGAQGVMSNTYLISSNEGWLIIQAVEINPTNSYLQCPTKLQTLTDVALRAHIPTGKILSVETFSAVYIIVQKMLEGTNAGRRTVGRDGLFMDEWFFPIQDYSPKVESIIARIHQMPLKKFGWLYVENDSVEGTHATWEQFLTTEVLLWVRAIGEAESEIGNKTQDLAGKAERFFEKVLPFISKVSCPAFVHGDVVNPSNILVQDNRVAGVIDWEWAVGADPAWEFAFLNQYPLTEYFKHFPELHPHKAREDFLKRTHVYEPLVLTMWTSSHAWHSRSELYDRLRHVLERTLLAWEG